MKKIKWFNDLVLLAAMLTISFATRFTSTATVDVSRLPDIPTLRIETADGTEPTCVEAVKEDDTLWGRSIADNAYVAGTLSLTAKNWPDRTVAMKFRIRGNSSAIEFEKKPYKLVLEEAQDLLSLGEAYAAKNWNLLNTGTTLNAYVGSYIGTMLGMEWQPRMMYVNLIVNGDWRGCYLLSEPVERGEMRCNISESGYLFENDAYWWNEDGLYFKTEHQWKQLGYTFKYPSIKTVEDERVTQLQQYMQQVEDKLLAKDSAIWDDIDMDSFCAWILARDLLGAGDAGGSNMYYYKQDYDEEHPNSSKVKMGPLWDFDASFMDENSWSEQHTREFTWFPDLFQYDEFQEAYWAMWEEHAETFAEEMSEYLDQIYAEQGAALDESRRLDQERWGTEGQGIREEIEVIKEWFEGRTEWMNSHGFLSHTVV